MNPVYTDFWYGWIWALYYCFTTMVLKIQLLLAPFILFRIFALLSFPFKDYRQHSKLSEFPLQQHFKNMCSNFNTIDVFCNKTLIFCTGLYLWQIKGVCSVENGSLGIVLLSVLHPREHAVMWDLSWFIFYVRIKIKWCFLVIHIHTFEQDSWNIFTASQWSSTYKPVGC